MAFSEEYRRLMRLYGLLYQGEAYLIHTWLMREQRLAQIQINQSLRQVSAAFMLGNFFKGKGS